MSDVKLRRRAWAAFGVWLLFIGATVAFVVLTPEGRGDSEAAGWWVMVPVALVAIVILARQPHNRVGWILMFLALLTALPLAAYGPYALAVGLPGGSAALMLGQSTWIPTIVLMGSALLLRFPTGQLPSPGWRWVDWLSVVAIVLPMFFLLTASVDFGEFGYPGVHNPFEVDWLPDVGSAFYLILLFVPLMLAIGVTSLVVRFRRSSGVERQQLKWLTAAAFCIGGLYLAGMIVQAIHELAGGGPKPAWVEVLEAVEGNSFVLIPIAIGLAVLRYRLYDIDRIISRTLGYAIVTAVLGSVFAGIVIGLQALALPILGGSELTIALSTLTVLALFGPVRRRVQNLVDRRFDRAHYDAARIAESFGARLREGLDLDAVSDELLTTTQAALRPASTSIWVRRSSG